MTSKSLQKPIDIRPPGAAQPPEPEKPCKLHVVTPEVDNKPASEAKDAKNETRIVPRPHRGRDLLAGPLASPLDLRPSNILRPPNWRWDSARHLLNGCNVLRRFLDYETAQARRLQQAIAQCRTDGALLAVSTNTSSPWPQMLEAVFLWREGGQLRDILEARLLTEDSFEIIAQKTGHSPETIYWFESFFYAVRNRLAAPDYVSCVLLRQDDIEESIAPSQNWKWYAYWGGAAVLDAILHGHTQGPNRLSAEFFRENFRQTLTMQAALALRSLDASDPRVAVKLLRLHQRYEEVKLRRQQFEKGEVDFARNMEVFIREWPTAYDRTQRELEKQFDCFHNQLSSGREREFDQNAVPEQEDDWDPLLM